jgi:hypothetical protein
MSDEELDELILSRLRIRREQFGRNELSDTTQSTTDLAASFNEPEPRVEARVLQLATEERIKESSALPGRLASGRPLLPAGRQSTSLHGPHWGRVAERLNAPVLKTGRRATPVSGFESPPSVFAPNPQPSFPRDWRELWREQSIFRSTEPKSSRS